MPYKNKERKRAYAQRPENKERKRAYAQRWYAENKERKRAYRKDLKSIMRRLELDQSGLDAILSAIADEAPYIEIAIDWLIEESDVSAIATAHGIYRRGRKRLVTTGATA